jgi:predicted pyridoxine 5'-phosphate oxidase superfamily flavin-nucleotide-binding protein
LEKIMNKSSILSVVAIIILAASMGISAVTHASQFALSPVSYVQVVVAVAFGVVAGVMIGCRQHTADAPQPQAE